MARTSYIIREAEPIKTTATSMLYGYSLRDHLGNTRVVFSDLDRDGCVNDSTEVLHEAHYYSIGIEMVVLEYE